MTAAVEAVRARAVALLRPGDELAMATDALTYSQTTKKPPAVLLAIARPIGSVVLAIDASEYDALQIAGMAGWDLAKPKTAMELLRNRG